MKIKELASELNLTADAVLEKAQHMCINVSDVNDEMKDILVSTDLLRKYPEGIVAGVAIVRAQNYKTIIGEMKK